MEDPSVESRQGQKNLFLPKMFRPAVGPTQPPIQLGGGEGGER